MKYFALLLNIAALAVFVWGISAAASLTRVKPIQIRPPSSEIKPLVEKDIQEQTDILRALKAIDGLKTHSQAASSNHSQTPLIAQPDPGAPGSAGPLMPERQVTLFIEGADGLSAIVDGQLVRQGAVLQGGGRVASIKGNELLITEKNGKQLLTLPEASQRIGTLYGINTTPQIQVSQFPLPPEGTVHPTIPAGSSSAQGIKP